jgi:DNA-binding XRE family transcriptional regulator
MEMTTDTGEFVRHARATLELSQTALGKLVGRTKRSIILYEQGEPLPEAVRLAILHLLAEHEQPKRRKAR